MPRARKTLSGAPAQGVQPVTGQQYGRGVEQAQMQQAMPTPRGNAAVTAAMAQGQAQAQARPAAAAAPAQQPDVMALASQLRNSVGLLKTPTDRPNEPVTAGLAGGPGPGPEVLGKSIRSPLGDTLRNLSRVSGDPIFQQLADGAGI